MRKLVIPLVALLIGLTTTIVSAQVDISTALYYATLTVNNTGPAATADITGHPLSAYSLVNQNFINADGLNSVVVGTGNERIPAMPGSTRIAYEAGFQFDDSGPTYTDYTTEINDATANDVIWFPASPAVDDAFYFGLYSPGRILSINNGTAGVYDMTVVWEYWDGSAWTSLPNLSDGTSGFTIAGLNVVTFDMPTDWIESTVNSTASYWIRARISAFTSITTAPLGTQAWWESGVWYVFNDSIGENAQINYRLYLGGATDLVDWHYIFPGANGIITPDDPSIELGDEYTLSISGYFDTDGLSTGLSYVVKGTAFRIYNPSAGVIRLSVDSGALILDVNDVASGDYTVSVVGSVNSTTLTVSGVDSTTGVSYSVPDTADIWVWMHSPLTRYVSDITIIFPVITDWASSGQMSNGGTLTNVMEYKDWNGTSIGSLATTGNNTGAVTVGSDYCYTTPISGSTNLICVSNTDATSVSSSCDTGLSSNVGALTYDGTNFWVSLITDSTIHEMTPSCTDVSNFSVSATGPGSSNGMAWNPDASRLAIFSSLSSNPTISIYQTDGTLDSTDTITAMSTYGVVSILAAEYRDGFYYVIGLLGSNTESTLWKLSSASNAVLLWRLDNDRYGYPASSSVSDPVFIQPGRSPFNATSLAYDGTYWYFYNSTTVTSSVQKQAIIKFTDINAHLQIANDWCTNLVDWSNLNCASTTTQRAGLASNIVLDGNYSVGMHRGTAGSWSTTQQTTSGSITPGLAYSFGVEAQCGGETTSLTVQFEDSGGSPVGSPLVTSTCVGGPWSELSIENQVAPSTSDHIQITLTYQCSGICGGGDNAYFDCVQAIQNTAIETPCATTSPNIVLNPSFEKLYQTASVSTNRWLSNAVSLSAITDVRSSTISWDQTTSGGSSLTIETSINGGSIWSVATSGEAIPGISPGDDLTGVSLLVRGTFNPSTDQTESPSLNSMQIVVSSDIGDGLEYQLKTIPTLTIEDEIGSNDGTLSFPLPSNENLSPSTGPLTPTGTNAGVQQDTQTPDIVDQVNSDDPTSAAIFNNPIPLNDLWQALSDLSGGDVPPIMFWVLIALLVILASGSYTFMYTGSVPWTGGVMGLFTLGFVNFGGGILPFWVFFFFGVMAMAIATYSKVKGL